jgi:imidazolonepropionase
MFDLRVDNARLYPMTGDARQIGARSFAVLDGRIVAFDADGPAREVFDAGGRAVLPGFIDCHTHALYAGDRMQEHVMKLQGASYADIARAGGGIMSTVRAVRAATEEELIAQTRPRIAALAAEGVTTVEIKSGYGLATEHELKMLRAIRRLGEEADEGGPHIVPTFLGAHTIPPDRDRGEYLQEVIDDMLVQVDRERLADTVDVFIESIAFNVDEARRLFDRARGFGMQVRAHAEQLSSSGASALAAQYGALSCDHLEYLDEAGAEALARAGAVAVLLPGAFYFLRETHLPPLALLRSHGVPMAVATDLNPGSSPVASLLTALHMAVILFGLTPEEALLGITFNAARVLGREDLGALAPGRRADFTVWDIPDPAFLTYQLGGLRPAAVFIGGRQR